MRVAMMAPMRTELRPLVRRLSLQRAHRGDLLVHEGTAGAIDVVATLTRIGTRPAAEVTERLLRAVPVDHLVVVGVAGGLDPHVGVGDLVVPEVVVDGPTGTEYRPTPLGSATPHGTMVTSDEFIVDQPRLARMADDGVVAVDMETAAIGAVCERLGCPWSVFRAISDMATDEHVDGAVLDLARPDGSANLPAVARYLLARPSRLGHLARLANGTRIATVRAANAAIRGCAEHERHWRAR